MTAEISVDSASIESDEDFEVSVDFAFAAPRHEPPIVEGLIEGLEYVISLHAEPLGDCPNKILGTRKGTISASRESDTIISVAAGTLPPGCYKLASTLVVKGSSLAGYTEGPIIEVC